MPRVPNEILNAINEKVNIVDVVRKYIPLTKKGRNYWAVCPFHEDSNPSMSVSPDKNIFTCFVCGTRGNSYSFVKEYENCSFYNAVQKVAQLTGFDDESLHAVENQKPVDPQLENIAKINQEALAFYKYSLTTTEGQEAIRYLQERGLKPDVVEKYQISYAPNNDKLINYLGNKGYNEKQMYEAGLISSSGERIYPMFRKRLMFPIHDSDSRIIGFSGRVIDDSMPKYINTPETYAFKKGNFLYNLNRSMRSIKNNKEAIVLEGFMDVIALDKVNITNTVATMGTAFTKEHAKLLRKLVSNIKVFMDGDKAGQKAAENISSQSKEYHFKTTVVKPLKGMDADEIIKSHGEDRLIEILSKTLTPEEFKLKNFAENIDLDSIQGKKEYFASATSVLNNVFDPFEREQYIQLVAQTLNLPDAQIKGLLNEPVTKKVADKPKIINPTATFKKWENGEKYIIQQMLIYKQAIEIYNEEFPSIANEQLKILAKFILNEYDINKEINLHHLTSKIENEVGSDEYTKLISELIMEDEWDEFKPEGMHDAISRVKQRGINNRIRDLSQEIQIALKESGDYKHLIFERKRLKQELMSLKKGSN